ncbi:MAG: carboxypeptidase-like regulatory domain-containing protein [Fibrobacter sp.]|nr:carboxypeptidase-like regulatory domain-containing protein [Fibrobacter sp.]
MQKKYLPLIVASFLSVFTGCSVTDSEDSEYSKWSFSGTVVDAASGQGLNGAQITYLGDDGKVTEAESDENGYFYISNLPYGSRTFTFSHTQIQKKDTLRYAPKTLNVASTNESSHMEGVVASSAYIVRMSPLNATLTGELYIIEESTNKRVPVSKTGITLTHSDTGYVNLIPESFKGVTDSLGKFKLNRLPADTGLVLKIDNFTYKNLSYRTSEITLPRLRSGEKNELPRIYLGRDTLIEEKSLIKASNVMDANLKGYKNISTLLTPYYVFNEKISSANLSVTVMGDTINFYVTPTIQADTLFLKHEIPFKSETEYTVSIIAYGKKSGDRISVTFEGDRAFTTDRGLYAVTSNAWPSNPKFKAVFGVEDTIWVKFSDELDKNVERVQWNFNSTAARTIYTQGYASNANAWVNKDTLFVQMKEEILDSRDVGDSVGFNITAFSKSGLTLENFMLQVELDVPETSSSSAEESSSGSTKSSSSNVTFVDDDE